MKHLKTYKIFETIGYSELTDEMWMDISDILLELRDYGFVVSQHISDVERVSNKLCHDVVEIVVNKSSMSDFSYSEVEDVFKRLIDYLEVVNRGHNTTELEKGLQFHDFKSFYVQYDIRRNKNFTETFPELKEWYESIEIDNSIPKREIFDGSITNYEAGEYVSDKENNNK